MCYRILVTEPMAEDGPDWLRANGYEVKYGRGIDCETLIEDLQDCDGVIPRLAVISDEVISRCPVTAPAWTRWTWRAAKDTVSAW